MTELTYGLILIVEYKGAHLTDAADADEKRAIGAVLGEGQRRQRWSRTANGGASSSEGVRRRIGRARPR